MDFPAISTCISQIKIPAVAAGQGHKLETTAAKQILSPLPYKIKQRERFKLQFPALRALHGYRRIGRQYHSFHLPLPRLFKYFGNREDFPATEGIKNVRKFTHLYLKLRFCYFSN